MDVFTDVLLQVSHKKNLLSPLIIDGNMKKTNSPKLQNFEQWNFDENPTIDELPLSSLLHNNIQAPNIQSVTPSLRHRNYFGAG